MTKLKIGFQLLKTISAKDDTDFALKDYYQSWKSYNKMGKVPFTTLYNSFKETHLKDIDGGPLKLYLYFCIHASNAHGESWHSIQKIANFFGTQTRTVDNWIKALVERDLIYREQKGNKSHTTYLIPYNNTLIQHTSSVKREEDNQSLLDEILSKIKSREFLYGKVTKVFHIFQWKNTKGDPDRNENTQLLFIISERHNGILIGHLCLLKKSNYLGINELHIENHSTFESKFQFNGTNIKGIALSHELPFNRKASTPAILELLDHLNSIEDWQLDEFPKVTYGEINEVLIDIEDADEQNVVSDSENNEE